MVVRQDYESEVRVNPCLCRWAIIYGVSVFFKGKGKLQRECADSEWVILLTRDNQRKSALEEILPRTNPQQILSLLTRVIKRMQMTCLYIICYLLLEIGIQFIFNSVQVWKLLFIYDCLWSELLHRVMSPASTYPVFQVPLCTWPVATVILQ